LVHADGFDHPQMAHHGWLADGCGLHVCAVHAGLDKTAAAQPAAPQHASWAASVVQQWARALSHWLCGRKAYADECWQVGGHPSCASPVAAQRPETAPASTRHTHTLACFTLHAGPAAAARQAEQVQSELPLRNPCSLKSGIFT
jgi:hypothetical protein